VLPTWASASFESLQMQTPVCASDRQLTLMALLLLGRAVARVNSQRNWNWLPFNSASDPRLHSLLLCTLLFEQWLGPGENPKQSRDLSVSLPSHLSALHVRLGELQAIRGASSAALLLHEVLTSVAAQSSWRSRWNAARSPAHHTPP